MRRAADDSARPRGRRPPREPPTAGPGGVRIPRPRGAEQPWKTVLQDSVKAREFVAIIGILAPTNRKNACADAGIAVQMLGLKYEAPAEPTRT